MRTIGLLCLLAAAALAWPLAPYMIPVSSGAEEAVDPSRGSMAVELGNTSEWSELVVERPDLRQMEVLFAPLATIQSWDGREARATIEMEAVDPTGVRAWHDSFDLAPRAYGSSTTLATTIFPKASGSWRVRVRVTRTDPAFADEPLQVFIDQRPASDYLSNSDTILMLSGGLFPLARIPILFLVGVSLLAGGFIEARRKSTGGQP